MWQRLLAIVFRCAADAACWQKHPLRLHLPNLTRKLRPIPCVTQWGILRKSLFSMRTVEGWPTEEGWWGWWGEGWEEGWWGWPTELWATQGCGIASETMLVLLARYCNPKQSTGSFWVKVQCANVNAFIKSNWHFVWGIHFVSSK